ncbi:maleylpyruvate isomerase family mycothiol-dependent enzyme [Nocardioides terrisoli]|uniref:maleylpyruvate isomerase family mycothiol-dependent enzyme n=1 Tax=Nocardioides terrisoli TaxID=3388267 RepID=UPI00287B6B35|nr:maleylpyruvate isomerase family mycothiol-dependent enzyme [Nocardioides marmorisolisilvae]
MLTFEEYGDGIGAGWTVIREHANRAGSEAAVPTCPGWSVHDLVAHQGMVHRWATALLRGQRSDTAALEAEGLAAVDQLDWFDQGVKALLQVLADAPEDLDVAFFLADPPPARLGWTRRQCHETTVHGVDAMSASFGRPPRAAETWIRPRLAADGVDELLTGFVPRPRTRLRSPEPHVVVVETSDTGDAWTMTISEDPVVTVRERAERPDTVLSGTAAQLYLGLWNRGDEITSEGAELLPRWRESMTVTWG